MEAEWTFETLVSYYNPEDLGLKYHSRKSLKTRNNFKLETSN